MMKKSIQSVQLDVPGGAAHKQNTHLATVPVPLIVVWVTVPFYPFLLALSATDETTEATQQTNTPAHGPEDNFPFPAAAGDPSLDFPDDLYSSGQLLK